MLNTQNPQSDKNGRHYKLMMVAGEASGDAHGAKLVNALRETENASFEFFGATSGKLREAGVEQIVNADELSIIGLTEIGRALPMFWRAFRKLKSVAVERRADVAILVDFPDFNLKLAKALKKRGIPVIYYISPQLWAWRKYRIRTIRKYVDLLISILPFEKEWYAGYGVRHVEYVGSPLAREVHPSRSKEQFCADHGLDVNRPIVALLPGSRSAEIRQTLPVMIEAADLMRMQNPGIQFVVAAAHGEKNIGLISQLLKSGRSTDTACIQNETYDLLNAADAAAITSGTATLEAGTIGTPMAIVYKTSRLNYALLRPLIDVEHFGLINLIAGERVAAELIQGDLNSKSLSDELFRLLEPETNAAVRHRLKEAADSLGHGGASKRAADSILTLLSNLKTVSK